MREQCLKLALACLSYDFFGTCSDETTEDVGTVQVGLASSPMRTPAPTSLSSRLLCRFDLEEVPATVITRNQLQCRTPAHAALAIHTFCINFYPLFVFRFLF